MPQNYFYTKPLEYISKDRHTVTAFLTCSRTIFHSSIIPYILMSGTKDRNLPLSTQKQKQSHLLSSSFDYDDVDADTHSYKRKDSDEVAGFSSTLWKNLAYVLECEQRDIKERAHMNQSRHGRFEQEDPLHQYEAITYDDAEERFLKLFQHSSTLQFTNSICLYTLNAAEMNFLLFDPLFNNNNNSKKSPYFAKSLRSFTAPGGQLVAVLKILLENCLALEYLDLSGSWEWEGLIGCDFVLLLENGEKEEEKEENNNNTIYMQPILQKTIKFLDLSGCFPNLDMPPENEVTPSEEYAGDYAAKLIRQFPSLETLKLEYANSISSNFFDACFPSSSSSSSLTSLSLVDTSYYAEEGHHPLSNAENIFQNLQHLNLQGSSELVGDGIESLKSFGQGKLQRLQKINLQSCSELTDEGLIGSLFSNIEFLLITHLNLSKCSLITNKFLQHVFGGHQHRLQHLQYLNLAHCEKINDEGMKFLNEGEEEELNPLTHSLEYLNLSNTSVSGATLVRLEHYTNLVTLSFGYVDEDVLSGHVKKLSNKLTKIEILDLREAIDLEDDGLVDWILNLPRLRGLYLNSCGSLTSKILEALYKRKVEVGVEYDLEELDISYCRQIDGGASEYLSVLTGLKKFHAGIALKVHLLEDDNTKRKKNNVFRDMNLLRSWEC